MNDVCDAGPAEAAKWRFVRRRCVAVFQAHAYHEVQPAPIEPAGSAPDALRLADGRELLADPMISLARTFVATGNGFARWMTAGTAYDAAPLAHLRWRAWHAVSSVMAGVAEPAADAEVSALALAIGADLGLRNFEVVLGSI